MPSFANNPPLRPPARAAAPARPLATVRRNLNTDCRTGTIFDASGFQTRFEDNDAQRMACAQQVVEA